jgi:SSS family solute:Na+ symporter
MIRVEEALKEWWRWAGIFSGGVLGLFFLGCLPWVSNRAALWATACGLGVIAWITLAPPPAGPSHGPINDHLAAVFGTLAVLLVGTLLSLVLGPRSAPPRPSD